MCEVSSYRGVVHYAQALVTAGTCIFRDINKIYILMNGTQRWQATAGICMYPYWRYAGIVKFYLTKWYTGRPIVMASCCQQGWAGLLSRGPVLATRGL